MSEKKKIKHDIEKGTIYGLSKGYLELQELMHERREKLISERQFLLGILIGILGNIVASYLFEFHMRFGAGNTLWGVILGLTMSTLAFVFFHYYYTRKRIKPIEKKITELESVMNEVSEQIDEAASRLRESK